MLQVCFDLILKVLINTTAGGSPDKSVCLIHKHTHTHKSIRNLYSVYSLESQRQKPLLFVCSEKKVLWSPGKAKERQLLGKNWGSTGVSIGKGVSSSSTTRREAVRAKNFKLDICR